MAWSKTTRISIMLGIDVAFFVLELSVGLIVSSLALMADAFHMVGLPVLDCSFVNGANNPAVK
jgi:Co/Zn/Cd efflux system component